MGIGKDTHHTVAVNRAGKRLFNKVLPDDENKFRALISDLKQHDQILLVVDQPATIGALPVTVARDAAIITEAARTLPHALRTLKLADEQIAELSMLCGFDDDLAAQTTQASSRIRGLLTRYIRLWSTFSARDRITRPCSICFSDIPRPKNSPRW